MPEKFRREVRELPPMVMHEDARQVDCPTCDAVPQKPCVTTTAPVLGKEMKLHHAARYAVVRKIRGY